MDQELLDAIRQIVREEVSGVKEDVSSLKDDVSTLKTDVSSLKGDVSTLKTDVSSLKNDVSTLKTDVSTLKNDVAEMKPQLKENTDMLRVLLANSETHGAEIKQLNHRVAKIEGINKRQDKLESGLLNHRHEVVFKIGEAVFED